MRMNGRTTESLAENLWGSEVMTLARLCLKNVKHVENAEIPVYLTVF
jgi:hypothetical protein